MNDMRIRFLIIPTAFLFQVTTAQNAAEPATTSPATVTTPASAVTSTPVTPPVPSTPAAPATPSGEESSSTQTTYLDYKNLYEAATVEEEVKMAAERFSLTTAQQDMWLQAATERREAEKSARGILDSKESSYEKAGVYRGLKSSQTTFHETIIGHLSPSQKQALETDRLILQEKQQRMAKLPPPAPTVTVAPVDSTAIKAAEAEKNKGKGKKSKKKKKAIAQ